MPHRSAIAKVIRPSLVAARSVASAASAPRPGPDLDQQWLSSTNPPVSRDRGGLLPESSSQARQRASTRFQVDHDAHVQHFGPPPEPPLPRPSKSNKHSDTIYNAMRKVIEIHSREPEAAPEPGKTQPPEAMPLPSLLHRLVSRRQFRLAVFHLLNTPTLASDPKLGLQLASMLENRGAGNLAGRLRRSYETDDASIPRKLADDLRGSNEPRSPGFWNVKPSPPEPLDETPLQGRTPAQRLTSHLNAQLSFHLRKSSLSQRIGPLQDSDDIKVPGPRWPEPAPNLLQLRRLLYTISRLESKQSFRPDRVTANIIIRCWLRCGQGPSPESDPFRVRIDREGNERIEEKQASTRILGSKEIMLMFRIVSTVMDKSIRSIDPQAERADGEMDWRAHVQPFSTMILRELRRLGDREAVRTVVGWEKGAKETLRSIRKARAYRQRTPTSDE